MTTTTRISISVNPRERGRPMKHRYEIDPPGAQAKTEDGEENARLQDEHDQLPHEGPHDASAGEFQQCDYGKRSGLLPGLHSSAGPDDAA